LEELRKNFLLGGGSRSSVVSEKDLENGEFVSNISDDFSEEHKLANSNYYLEQYTNSKKNKFEQEEIDEEKQKIEEDLKIKKMKLEDKSKINKSMKGRKFLKSQYVNKSGKIRK